MSTLEVPGQRAGNWVTLGDHQRRIQNLEATAVEAGGEGLQFNSGTYGPANVGDYLSVETTAANGIHLFAGGTGGINLEATAAGDASLSAYAGDVNIVSVFGDILAHAFTGGILILSDAGNATLSAPAGNASVLGQAVIITADDGAIYNTALGGTTSSMIQNRVSDGNYFSIMNNTPIEQFRLTVGNGTGSVLQIANPAGALILRLDGDSNLHLKAGASIIYDL